MRFWDCVWLLVCNGILGFLLGRFLPKEWLQPDRFPFAGYAWEQGGRAYEKLGIRRWQNRLPDMSKLFPKLMPPKDLQGDYGARLPVMIRETCVAELMHGVHALAGLHCLQLWPGAGGLVMALLNALLFNLPFILIQRFNRPRLQRLAEKYQRIGTPQGVFAAGTGREQDVGRIYPL